jgi:hypothetical protein
MNMTSATEKIKFEKVKRENMLGRLSYIEDLADQIKKSARKGRKAVRKFGSHAEYEYINEKTRKIENTLREK